jgi:hypothetical protein
LALIHMRAAGFSRSAVAIRGDYGNESKSR